MADGTLKPIRLVRVGDRVITTDPKTGKRRTRTVTATWWHYDQIRLLDVDGETIATTAGHPIYNQTDQQWQAARDLDPGDRLVTAAADTCARTLTRAAAIGLAWNPFPGPPTRYDLPGELSAEQRPEHPDGWIALAGAADRLAEASCQPDAEQLVQAWQLLAQTVNYLRGQITPER